MNASSQTPGPVPGPVALQHSPAAQAAHASPPVVNPDVPMSLVVHRPEPLMPQCFNCGTRKGALTPCPQGRRYPSGSQVLQCAAHTPATTPVQAATGVITAAMEQGHTAPAEIADAEEAAGILFDPQHAKAIADAAYQQAKAEDAVELAQAAQDREARDWLHARWKTLGQLCEGRHPEDMLRVDEVLAALDAQVPTTAPLTLTWDGIVSNPAGDRPGEATLVAVTTARGGQAVLTLDFEQRVTLGGQLLATPEPCPTPDCGTPAGNFAEDDPTVFGWICVQVAGLDAPPRWWCSPWCVTAAIAAAGAELADVDQAADVDPNEPVAYTLTPDAGPVPYALTEQLHDVIAGASESAAAAVLAPAPPDDDVDQVDELDARYGAGASDEYALQVAEATEAGFEDERGADEACDAEDGDR